MLFEAVKYSLVSFVALAVLVIGCGKRKDEPQNKRTQAAANAAARPLDLHDPKACVECHPAIHAEYEQSMHARAHYKRDPIFRAVRAVRMNKEGAAIAKACDRCHQPDAKATPNLLAGVTCFACHSIHAGSEPGVLIGPHDIAANATEAHKSGPSTAPFKDGRALCLVCHAALSSAKGVAMCTTGPEHATVMAGAKNTCVDCHMRRVKGPGTKDVARTDHASHAFLGPHRAWYQNDPSFVATGVKLVSTLKPGALKISMTNQSGHGFPTGFPGRVAQLDCRGFDASGRAVWSCEPIRLGKVYVDANGKPTLAPYAVKLAVDSRLEAGATISFDQRPPSGVTKVEVVLSLRLLPAKLAKKLKLSGTLEAEVRMIAKTVAISRPTH